MSRSAKRMPVGKALSPARQSYPALLGEIKERIRRSQYGTLRALNRELVALYWDIGRLIQDRQQGRTWGRRIVTRLVTDHQKEFPGMGGFSASNLSRMKLIFETCPTSEILAPLVRENG